LADRIQPLHVAINENSQRAFVITAAVNPLGQPTFGGGGQSEVPTQRQENQAGIASGAHRVSADGRHLQGLRIYRRDADNQLAARVTALTDWIAQSEPTAGLGIGLFGASTGAAAALIAAMNRPRTVQAVVSRGGRPDLADAHLHQVRQPTLLIVGERDPVVIELNRQAMRKLHGETRLEIIPGASHLFEEPGTLEQVARLARNWFLDHLRAIPSRQQP